MTERWKLAQGLILTLWVVATLCVATAHLLGEGPRQVMVCRLLENAWVPTTPAIYAACPLEPYARVEVVRTPDGERRVNRASELKGAWEGGATSVELRVVKGGVRRWETVPIVNESRAHLVARAVTAWVVTGLIHSLSMALLFASSAAAVRPLTYFFSCVSVVLVWFLFGYESDWLGTLARPAYSLMPATVFHLALTFPREREILRAAPGVLVAPYAVSVLLWWVGQLTVERSPAVWALADRLVFLLTIAAAGACALSCYLAFRESDSKLERIRARSLAVGAVFAFLIPLALELSVGDAIPGASMLLPILGVVMIPAVIGYAIARYHLFGLRAHVRRAVALGTQLVAVSAGVTMSMLYVVDEASLLEHGPVMFAASLALLAMVEVGRSSLRRIGDEFLSPWQERLSLAEHRYAERSSELMDPVEVAGELGESIRSALEPRWLSVFTKEETGNHLSYASGAGAATHLDAELEAELSGLDRVVRLIPEEGRLSPALRALIDSDVEVVVPIRRGDEWVGAVMLSERFSGIPYGSRDAAFLAHVAAQCAVSVLSTRLASQIILNERYMAVGRVEANLAHEIGKPLGVLQVIVSQLRKRGGHDRDAKRDVETIANLSGEMRAILRSLSRAAAEPQDVADCPLSVDPVATLQDASDRATRVSGRPVSIRVAATVPHVNVDRNGLFRVLVNLLENAALACPRDGDLIEAVVTTAGNEVFIEISDSGAGMSVDEVARAFDPFFTTRAGSKGTGLGLPISRELLERYGGRLELESEPGAGTRARVVLPMSDPIDREEEAGRGRPVGRADGAAQACEGRDA